MLRIDFYVQHLLRHNALGIELVSGKPVKFELPSGERSSSKPIEHAQIAGLVQEAAPAGVLDELRSTGFARFFHKSAAGMDVDVQLTALSPGAWTVRVEPAKAAPASAPALGEVPASMPDPAPVRQAAPLAQPAPIAQPAPAHSPPKQSAPQPPKRAPMVAPGDEPAINRYLRLMKEMDASDLHLSTGVAPMARIHGSMKQLEPGH
ncbi:MAG: hypothetical protein AAF645_20935, partial [Myxococcota bacterium]